MKLVLILLVSLCVLMSTALAQDSRDTVTVSKSEFDALKQKVEQMEREISSTEIRPGMPANPPSRRNRLRRPRSQQIPQAPAVSTWRCRTSA